MMNLKAMAENKIKLYQHQQDLIDDNKPKSLLPWGCGTGKTYGFIALIKKNNAFNEPTLIITIKSDKGKWVDIVEKFGINGDVMTKEEFKKATTKQVLKKVFREDLMEMVDVKKKYNNLVN